MADELPLTSFEVDGFRAIRRARFPQMGRVNLFVGKNNSGKTSLLQAIQLYLERNSDALPGIVLELARAHSDVRPGADTRRQGEVEAHEIQGVVDAVEALFHGSFAGEPLRPIHLGPAFQGEDGLSLSLPWSAERTNVDGEPRPVLIDPQGPLLELRSEAVTTLLPLDWFTRRVPLLGSGSRTAASFIPATGFSPTRTRELWDRVVVSGEEYRVEEAVRTVVPGLERIVVVGELRLRKVLCKLHGVPRPVPLLSMGDGANRVFGLAVALVQARDGAVLMDEVENGLHHSVQADAWESIFMLAEQLNVQVFATTHSWDAVVGFQDAAIRSNADGLLYRLEREEDGSVYPERYTEAEVAIAADQQVEVR